MLCKFLRQVLYPGYALNTFSSQKKIIHVQYRKKHFEMRNMLSFLRVQKQMHLQYNR